MTPRKPSIQSLGGLARAAKLSQEERTAIARKGGQALTPEARHAAILKGWETRRKNAAENKTSP
jgi:hypothetical protein